MSRASFVGWNFFGEAILSQLPIHSHNMGQAAEPAATLLQNQNN